MTTLWIFIALFLLVSLVLIWFPHFQQQKMLQAEEAGVRKQTNLELFHNRLETLEKELEDEQVDQAEFDALKKELEISLLQDMKQGSDESLVTDLKPKGLLWPIVMSVAVLGISGYFYSTLGAYANLDQAEQVSARAGMTSEQIMQQRLQMMENQAEAEPENSQLLFSLGHSYISANRYNDAINTFDKAMVLVGVQAELLGPKATAMYYKANQQMTPAVQAVVDKSLSLDPEDPSTLLLVGMNAFFTAEYQTAINSWQIILDSERKDVDRSAIINAIDSAKMRLQTETGKMPNDAAHAQVKGVTKTVNVEVSVSPELLEEVGSSDMLFIFARNTEGPKVPLAAIKISAKSLPTTITLDDSTSMGGDVKLSGAKEVEIIAVLSKHGTVKPQTGDLQGYLAAVKVGATAQLIIDKQVE
ncbi:c-type cytochrome biogenesis protein CcmI [Shewanella sp. D64]|uniref:c-type cytochrome biogenesis protein CcmI n=1 Tax=unclassified Shewanella TaxID=196818 RepID=UPI0022BA3822|nr:MULTISPECIES: c-type cytochrome biogenesis protein CcmI [unclassified Shewanella]MEC4728798.1 c-type cytochrome biogenesis protein CcmI [Shewanella sp. D64]MEC4740702.1 c-type cytochrome biogenesis protein CcmI [Shewanella sp. E94]WBJ95232.1 c-type cytochrome biogenesis protein CcmI [Shewanella sp. MTB7]